MSEGTLAAGEREQLVYQLQGRMSAHREAAASAVRQAESDLADVRERLAAAEADSAHAGYTSDPLPFMRASVAEEVETLERVSNEKKVRASYRFLVDRAVELAAAEVQGFHDETDRESRERTGGLAALREAEHRAVATLEAARQMQERVQAAEDAAQEGLRIMVAKFA